jgi:hypothetical protein
LVKRPLVPWKDPVECARAIVLHQSGLNETYGKTEEDKEATPGQLMADNCSTATPPVVLINIDIGEAVHTVVHRVARNRFQSQPAGAIINPPPGSMRRDLTSG